MLNTMLVDTDVLIDFLRGYNKAISFIKQFSSQIIPSPIVGAELKTLNIKHYPMIRGLKPAYKK